MQLSVYTPKQHQDASGVENSTHSAQGQWLSVGRNIISFPLSLEGAVLRNVLRKQE